jgi:flavodoxin
MKKLFIYYSYTGNGDIVAEHLKSLRYEIRKVEANYKLSKNLFLSMMKGGFVGFRGKKPKLNNYDNNIDDYEEVIIGSPIWNGRLAPVCNSILNETNLSNKHVSFILYSGSGEAKVAIKKLSKLFKNAKVIVLNEPKKYTNEVEKVGLVNE